MKQIKAYVIGDQVKELNLYIADMTEDEKKIVKAGCCPACLQILWC